LDCEPWEDFDSGGAGVDTRGFLTACGESLWSFDEREALESACDLCAISEL
jgi:hypothetical protein